MDANKAIAEQLVGEIFNRGNMRVFDALFADDYVNHNMPMPGVPGTKEGFRQVVLGTRQAFPDVHVEIEDIVAEGDMVVFHDKVSATNTGDFMGIAASGKRINWTEIHFFRVRAGQISEHWANFDQLGMLQQLGAIATG